MAISCGVLALALTACYSQRGRAWIQQRRCLWGASVHGEAYLEALMLWFVMAAIVNAHFLQGEIADVICLITAAF